MARRHSVFLITWSNISWFSKLLQWRATLQEIGNKVIHADLHYSTTLRVFQKWIILREIWSSSNNPVPSYDSFTVDMLRYIVTLTIDLLTLNGCGEFFIVHSNNLGMALRWKLKSVTYKNSFQPMLKANKKVLLSQGNCAMPQLFFSVYSCPTTFMASLRVTNLWKPGFRAP